MTTNIERAAEVLRANRTQAHPWTDEYGNADCSWSFTESDELAKALADAGLLKTDAEQAVIDAAIRVRRCRNKSALEVYAAFKVLDEAVDAYLASKEQS